MNKNSVFLNHILNYAKGLAESNNDNISNNYILLACIDYFREKNPLGEKDLTVPEVNKDIIKVKNMLYGHLRKFRDFGDVLYNFIMDNNYDNLQSSIEYLNLKYKLEKDTDHPIIEAYDYINYIFNDSTDQLLYYLILNFKPKSNKGELDTQEYSDYLDYLNSLTESFPEYDGNEDYEIIDDEDDADDNNLDINDDDTDDNDIDNNDNIDNKDEIDNAYYETFVLIVINDILMDTGVSQLKYSLYPSATKSTSVNIQKRFGIKNNDGSITWLGWQNIIDNSIYECERNVEITNEELNKITDKDLIEGVINEGTNSFTDLFDLPDKINNGIQDLPNGTFFKLKAFNNIKQLEFMKNSNSAMPDSDIYKKYFQRGEIICTSITSSTTICVYEIQRQGTLVGGAIQWDKWVLANNSTTNM